MHAFAVRATELLRVHRTYGGGSGLVVPFPDGSCHSLLAAVGQIAVVVVAAAEAVAVLVAAFVVVVAVVVVDQIDLELAPVGGIVQNFAADFRTVG